VGTVCATALLGCLVDLDVLDNQVGGVQTLGVGVGLGVLEKAREELGRLDGPASLADAELLSCGTKLSQYGYPLCILAHGWPQVFNEDWAAYIPWAVRPVLPAYLRMGTASLFSWTFWR
jgi:hypothetical protein